MSTPGPSSKADLRPANISLLARSTASQLSPLLRSGRMCSRNQKTTTSTPAVAATLDSAMLTYPGGSSTKTSHNFGVPSGVLASSLPIRRCTTQRDHTSYHNLASLFAACSSWRASSIKYAETLFRSRRHSTATFHSLLSGVIIIN